jgi:hypothetical protein
LGISNYLACIMFIPVSFEILWDIFLVKIQDMNNTLHILFLLILSIQGISIFPFLIHAIKVRGYKPRLLEGVK